MNKTLFLPFVGIVIMLGLLISTVPIRAETKEKSVADKWMEAPIEESLSNLEDWFIRITFSDKETQADKLKAAELWLKIQEMKRPECTVKQETKYIMPQIEDNRKWND